MHCKKLTGIVGALALAIGISGCSRDGKMDTRDTAAADQAALESTRAAELQRERDQELSKMDDRVASMERKYEEKRNARPQGTAGTMAPAGVREELRTDMSDAKTAVSDLRTTTPDNWWSRHESALNGAADEVEADVKRFSATRSRPAPRKDSHVADAAGEPVSTGPFTSSRDKFVSAMRTRLDAMSSTLDNVKATGPRKTELEDLKARVNKLGDDIDRLKSASAEDWWDLSKTRVNDYIERIEASIDRLGDNNAH